MFDLSLLPVLKDKLVREKKLADVWSYFMDNFGDNPKFIEDSEGIAEHQVLQKILLELIPTFYKVSEPTALRVDFRIMGFSKENFYHGVVGTGKGNISFMYFDDIRVGSTLHFTGFYSGETRFTRFVCEKFAGWQRQGVAELIDSLRRISVYSSKSKHFISSFDSMETRCHLPPSPKCFLNALCVDKTMTVSEWINMAADELDVDGLEFYWLFTPPEPAEQAKLRALAESRDLAIPMMCYSPDFIKPDPDERRAEIERQKEAIVGTAYLGGKFCRVLSGQRRTDVSVQDGIKLAADSIIELIPVRGQARRDVDPRESLQRRFLEVS